MQCKYIYMRPTSVGIEPLEQRIAPAIFLVTNLLSTGGGSLRQGILDANARVGADTINFSVSGTIPIASPLPVITDTLTIDTGSTGAPRIELNGSAAGAGADGLKFISTNPTQSLTVRGLAITRFGGDGIEINGGGGHAINSNYLGVSPFFSGKASVAGNGGNGLLIADALKLSVGDGGGNIISSNALAGIAIRGMVGNVSKSLSATINNNRIGTDPTGTLDFGNGGDGVSIAVKVGSNIFVGTGAYESGTRNVISGNAGYGVRVSDDGSVAQSDVRAMVCLFGGFIGTDVNGAKAIGNDLGGVFFSGLVGGKLGSVSGSNSLGNLISGNHGPGITVSGIQQSPPLDQYKSYGTSIASNKIGTDRLGLKALGNEGAGIFIADSVGVTVGAYSYNNTNYIVERNLISGNAGAGILLRGGSSDNIGANIIGLNADARLDLGNISHGIEIDRSPGFVIDGYFAGGVIVSGNGGDGIFIHDTIGGNRTTDIPGNSIGRVLVGTNGTGDRAVGNDGAGIRIADSSSVSIGDSSVVSGNRGNGITVTASIFVSIGSAKIGTNLSGSLALPNGGDGIQLIGSNKNTIGSTLTVIAGNAGAGVALLDGIGAKGEAIGSSFNTIQRTYIGLGSDGFKAIQNGSHGILISGEAGNNNIGGKIVRTGSGAVSSLSGNVISANGGDGIHIETTHTHQNAVTGNLIGTDRTGQFARGNESGIVIIGSTGERVGGRTLDLGNVIAANRGDGLRINAAGTVVLANYVGTDVTGKTALGNGGDGVAVRGSNNFIGIDNTLGGLGNRIASNGRAGIRLLGDENRVSNNTVAFNIGDGIHLSGSRNTIGGDGEGKGNAISGNGGHGVFFDALRSLNETSENVIAGNGIGLPLTVTIGERSAFGNGGDGIRIEGDHVIGTIIGSGNRIANSGGNGIAVAGGYRGGVVGTQIFGNDIEGNGAGGIRLGRAADSMIGGTDAGLGNVISGNGGAGIATDGSTGSNQIRANLISQNTGAGVAVLAGAGQTISANSIFSNRGPAIDLGDDGPTANDPGDEDSGPNHLQNFAALRSVVTRGSQTLIRGALASTPGTHFRVEFFVNENAAPEGQTFLDSFEISTDASGHAALALDVSALPTGRFITATVTDLNTNPGDTSEFSPSVENIAAPAIVALAASPGHQPRVTAVDAMTGAIRFDLLAYEPGFRGGIHVATGDFDRDGFDDVAVAPGAGHPPEVKVFSGFDGTQILSFLSSGSRFKRGVFLAAEDLDGDGRVDIAVSGGLAEIAGSSVLSAPHMQVAVFNTRSLTRESGHLTKSSAPPKPFNFSTASRITAGFGTDHIARLSQIIGIDR